MRLKQHSGLLEVKYYKYFFFHAANHVFIHLVINRFSYFALTPSLYPAEYCSHMTFHKMYILDRFYSNVITKLRNLL